MKVVDEVVDKIKETELLEKGVTICIGGVIWVGIGVP